VKLDVIATCRVEASASTLSFEASAAASPMTSIMAKAAKAARRIKALP
jgi:hypothetical protein